MNIVKSFIDKVNSCEQKNNSTVTLTLEDAKLLRDEVNRIYMLSLQHVSDSEPLQINISGEKW